MKKLLHPRYLFGALLIMAMAFFLFSPEIAEMGPAVRNTFSGKQIKGNDEDVSALKSAAAKKIGAMQSTLDKFTPQNAYMIINTTENRFELYDKGQKVRDGFCSTGSLIRLHTDSDREWVFKTPKGRLAVQSKITNPVWIKPDWVFIEEGLPIPPANHPSRYESGVLGDYALSLGRGYLIHGTLYQRLLGMPVTHGCVRLGDDDLEIVYKTMSIGSKVYIY